MSIVTICRDSELVIMASDGLSSYGGGRFGGKCCKIYKASDQHEIGHAGATACASEIISCGAGNKLLPVNPSLGYVAQDHLRVDKEVRNVMKTDGWDCYSDNEGRRHAYNAEFIIRYERSWILLHQDGYAPEIHTSRSSGIAYSSIGSGLPAANACMLFASSQPRNAAPDVAIAGVLGAMLASKYVGGSIWLSAYGNRGYGNVISERFFSLPSIVEMEDLMAMNIAPFVKEVMRETNWAPDS